MYYNNLINVKSEDIVLEIGPGSQPFWRSDVLADKYDNDDTIVPGTFGGGFLNKKGKIFYKIHDNKLLFKSNSFDLIIISHVLEHVPHVDIPNLLCEIFRVAPKAYIEFPTPIYEHVRNIEAHVNMLLIIDNTIFCLPKVFCSSLTDSFTEYMRHIFNIRMKGIWSHHKDVLSCGKIFYRDDWKFNVCENELQFFKLSAQSYIPPKPGFIYKVFSRIHGILWCLLIYPLRLRIIQNRLKYGKCIK